MARRGMPKRAMAMTFAIGPDGTATSRSLEAYDDLGFRTLKWLD